MGLRKIDQDQKKQNEIQIGDVKTHDNEEIKQDIENHPQNLGGDYDDYPDDGDSSGDEPASVKDVQIQVNVKSNNHPVEIIPPTTTKQETDTLQAIEPPSSTDPTQGIIKVKQMQEIGSVKNLGMYTIELARSPDMTDEQQSNLDARRFKQTGLEKRYRYFDIDNLAEQQNQRYNREPRKPTYEEEGIQKENNAMCCCKFTIFLVIITRSWKYSETLAFWNQTNPMVNVWWVLDAIIYFIAGAYHLYQRQHPYGLGSKRNVELIIFIFTTLFGIIGQILINTGDYTIINSLNSHQIDIVFNYKKEQLQAGGDVDPLDFMNFNQWMIFQVWARVILLCLLIFLSLGFGPLLLNKVLQNRNFDAKRRNPVQSKKWVGQNSLPVLGLHEQKSKEEKDMCECAICFEYFMEGDGKEVVELDCKGKHIFHLECLEKWVGRTTNLAKDTKGEEYDIDQFGSQYSCPICQTQIQQKQD